MIRADYYSILKLTWEASASEIKKTYKRLTLKCHPDHHPEDPEAEEKFKEISEAYSALGDAQKRREYDLLHYPHSTMSDIHGHVDKGTGKRSRCIGKGTGRGPKPDNFAQNTFLNVKPGQFLEFVFTPEEGRLGAERFVLITLGKRRHGYRIRIPGGVSQGTQFKAML